MKQVQRLLKELIETPEPELARAMAAVEHSGDPAQWEDLIWRMSMALGRETLHRRFEQIEEPPGSPCPHCAADAQPPSSQSEAGLSPP